MASGVITGNRYGGTYGPWLSIHYNEVEKDTANNRTKLRLTLRFHSDAPLGINYTFYNRTGYLQGQSFSYSGTASGTSVLLNLHQRDVWFSHNSDGTRRVTLSGDIRNLGLYFSGTNVGTMAVSGSVNLTPLQRSSTLSAFSFPSHLKEGEESTINYTVNRYNSNFRHQLQLKDGSVTVLQWQSVNSNGSSTLSLTGGDVNKILARMPNDTSKTFTLRLATRREHNGSFVGAVVTRTAKATVHADVEPYINWTSAKVTGNTWSVNQGLFVQGQTGVEADFSSNSTGHANVASRSISIEDNSGGGIVDKVFRHSVGVLRQSGDHKITYTITDTRGRSASATRTINVLAYTPPRIEEFKAERQEDEETIRIDRRGTTHTLGGRNTASLTIVETLSNGTSSNAQHIASFSGVFDNHVNRTVSGDLSATYTLTVSDTLGNQAHSTVTVGTAFMEFSIRRGEGVGIGKVHEQGVLDVDGEVYLSGRVMALGGLGFEDTRYISEQPQEIPSKALSFSFKSASNISSPPERANERYAHVLNVAGWSSDEDSGGYPMQMSIGSEGISLRQGTSATEWSPWSSLVSLSTGSNSGGTARWWRFGGPAGLQICTGTFSHDFGVTLTKYVDLPASFMNTAYFVSLSSSNDTWQPTEVSSTIGAAPTTASKMRFQRYNNSAHNRSNGTYSYRFIAMGRWN